MKIPPPLEAITPREKEIIKLLMEDHNRKMIATDLKIKFRTLETHIRNIHVKTNTHTIAGIVVFGFKYLKETG